MYIAFLSDIKYFIFFIVFIIFFNNCYNLKIASPGGKNFIVLGKHSLGTCKIVKEFKQWNFLYGLIPIKPISITNYFFHSNPDRLYIVEQSYTPTDIILSIVLGFITALTRNTIYIFQCKDKFVDGLTYEEKQVLIGAIQDDSAKCIEKGHFKKGKIYKIYIPE